MSFTPINPNNLPLDGTAHTAFQALSNSLTLPLLTQPKPDPSIVMDIDHSTAIDTICHLLQSDFTDSRAAWLHLMASLVADACNGVLNTICTTSIDRFQDLTPSEQCSLDSLKGAIESFDTFFTDIQENPDAWVTCIGCMQSSLLPVDIMAWDMNLTACNGMIQAAHETIVNKYIRNAHPIIEAWVTGKRIAAQDTAIAHLVSNHAPDFSSLISDPCVTEWAHHLLKAMRHHFSECLLDDTSSTLPQHIRDNLDACRSSKIDKVKRDASKEARHTYSAALQNLQAPALEEVWQGFETWKTDVLMPEWQAKEEKAHKDFARFQSELASDFAAKRDAARTDAIHDLAAFHVDLASESEKRKDTAHTKASIEASTKNKK